MADGESGFRASAGASSSLVPEDGLRRTCERAVHEGVTLAGRRVVVTGASGFFGAWIVETLRSLPAGPERLVVVTRDASAFAARWPSGRADRRVRFVSADVRAPLDFGETVDDVFHLATSADARLNDERPFEMFDTVVEGTRHVLDAARRAGAARFLFASSGAVYGAQPPEVERVSEDYSGAPSPLDPRASYHNGKRAAEHLCALASGAGLLECKIARGFAFSGPGLPLDRHFAFGNFVRDAALGREIRVNGDGRAVRSYLDAEDLVGWLLGILVRGRPGHAYNVGSELGISVRDLAARIATLAGGTFRIEGTASGGAVHRYVPSTERARKELGLAETVSLDESILRSLAWARRTMGRER